MDISNLTIGTNTRERDANIMTEIDKHVEIKFLKKGRHKKTYVFGLHDFIEKEKDLKKGIEALQKKLGTSVVEEEEDGKKGFGFGGDHVAEIKKLIQTDFKIPKEKIR